MTLHLPYPVDDPKIQANFDVLGQYLAGVEEAEALAARDAAIALKAAAIQPAARVTKAAAQSINSASPAVTTLTFDTEDFDNTALHDPGSPTKLTAPSAGLYIAVSYGLFAAATGAAGALGLQLNGVSIVGLDLNGNTQGTVTAIRSLIAGDYIEAVARQNSGAPVNITASLAMARLSSV